MEKLKYLGYTIMFQEVPDEISLTVNISGCPYKCKGCHSQYLWEYDGNYLSDDIESLIDEYDGLVSCFCFMGGDQNMKELEELINYVTSRNLKVAIYSGSDDFDKFKPILNKIDFLKIGRYIEELTTDDNVQYGVKLATSNQKIYKKYLDY